MLSPGDSLGHYRILSQLGAGGMGEVYLAEDTKLRRNVAVKVLPAALLSDPERRRRFLHEARAAASVDHPNVIHIYEVGEEPDGRIYLVMQHVEGKTLRQALGAGRLPIERALALAVEVADALAAAHAKGIVHRDVKPDNVMLDGSGHARILDFGLARAFEAAGSGPGATELETITRETGGSGKVMGTVAYMSPEQARGDAVDGRSDIFSFGVTIYETVTGRHPFAGRTGIDTVDALLNRAPAPVGTLVPGSPPELEWVLSKMLAKDREMRHQSAREVLADLKRLQHSTPGTGAWAGAAGPPARPAPAAPRAAAVRRFLPPWLIITVAAIAAGTVIAVFGPGGSRGRRPARPDRDPEFVFKVPGHPVPPIPDLSDLPLAGEQIKKVVLESMKAARAAAAPMNVAVLPFQSLRRDPKTDFLGFALADALISKLSYVRSVSVRPSAYVQKYRDQAPDPKRAGEELGVDHLVSGHLQSEGDRLRISVQFVDLSGEAILWQDAFDVRIDNLLSVQDEVVGRIVEGMKLSLSPEERGRIERDVAHDARAYEMFLRAAAQPDTEQGNEAAVSLLERSLEREEEFAPAWAELAERQYRLAVYGGGRPDLYDASDRSVREALEINPDLPAALSGRAGLLTERGRHEEAYEDVRRWLDVNPSAAEAHFALSYLFRYSGLLREAIEAAERAFALSPGNPAFRSAGLLYMYLGQHDRAIEIFEYDPTSSFSMLCTTEAEYLRGDLEKARAEGRKCVAADSGSSNAGMAEIIIRLAGGDRAGAAAALREIPRESVPDPERLYNLGAWLAESGDLGGAADRISRAVAGGFYPYPLFLTDPLLKSLRERPEFKPILEEAKRKHDAFRAFVESRP